MHKQLKYFGVFALFFMLVLVRAYAKQLFYDPFIAYFKDDYLHQAIPEFNSFKLYLNIAFRYWLNTLISMGIIYLLFQKQFLKFSLQFYSIAFIILLILLLVVLQFNLFKSYLPLFYLRRFLIHPIFVLLLIPAFYYQKNNA